MSAPEIPAAQPVPKEFTIPDCIPQDVFASVEADRQDEAVIISDQFHTICTLMLEMGMSLDGNTGANWSKDGQPYRLLTMPITLNRLGQSLKAFRLVTNLIREDFTSQERVISVDDYIIGIYGNTGYMRHADIACDYQEEDDTQFPRLDGNVAPCFRLNDGIATVAIGRQYNLNVMQHTRLRHSAIMGSRILRVLQEFPAAVVEPINEPRIIEVHKPLSSGSVQ